MGGPSSRIGGQTPLKVENPSPVDTPVAPKKNTPKAKPKPLRARAVPPPPQNKRELSPGQRAFYGPIGTTPAKTSDDRHIPPPPTFIRYIIDAVGRIHRAEEKVSGTTPQTLTQHILAGMTQWSIEVPTTRIIATGMEALGDLEKIVRMTPEQLAALGKNEWAKINDNLKLFNQGAQAVFNQGTDGGLHPEKALEYHVNHAYQAMRAGEKTITVEGSIVGINMTAINAADHSYRSGDAVRDAVTQAAREIFGHDSVTRLNNTNVVLCGVGEQKLTDKWPEFKQRVASDLATMARDRKLPIKRFSGFDFLYAYTAKTSVTAAEVTPGILETKIGRHIAELSAGEKKAGTARASASNEGLPIYKGMLTEAAINEAAKDSFYLFHAPEAAPQSKMQNIPQLDSGGKDRPDFKITAQDKAMRSSHQFGFLKGLSSAFQAFFADVRERGGRATEEHTTRLTKMIDAISSGSVDAGIDLSRYNYRFSDGKTGVMLKPQYLGEELARQAMEIRASAGPGAEIEFHVFFTELRKAGDYLSAHKSNLKDGNYRITLDIPLKGLAQAGLTKGTQSIVGGDEVVWVRMEVKGKTRDPQFSQERVQHVVEGIQKQFERIHSKRSFQPSEKVPFEGGKYEGVRFGFESDGTLIIEKSKGIGKKATLKKTTGNTGFVDFISKHFGPKATAALANPKKIRVVADLGEQGSVSRHKIWTDPTVKNAEIYAPRGTTPPDLIPRKQTLGIDVAHGKTGDARDIFSLISKLGHAVSGAKSNGGKLVGDVTMGFWDKAQTRGEYRLAGGGLSWIAGSVISTAVVGGINYLMTGKTHDLRRLLEPSAYTGMAKDFFSTTAIAKTVEASGRYVYAKIGVALTGARASGLQGAAALAAALLPMALKGQLSVEQAFHAVSSMTIAWKTSSLIMKGLRAGKVLTAESGWGIVASAAIEFCAIEGYQAILEHRAITHQHDDLRSHLVDSMRDLDKSILDLQPTSANHSLAEDRVAKAYDTFRKAYQDYVSFVALYHMPEGEPMLEALKKRDSAVENLGNYLKESASEVVQKDDDGNVTQLGLPNDGFETTLPIATQATTQRLQEEINTTQSNMDKVGKDLHAAWTRRLTAAAQSSPPDVLAVDIHLSTAAEPETPDSVIVTGPAEKTVVFHPEKLEHVYSAQLSRESFIFQAQLQKYIQDRMRIIEEEIPRDKLINATQPPFES